MEARLEHANLSVRDVEAMIRFLMAAFPEFRVRGVELLRARLNAADYRDSTVPNVHPYRKRVYFYDPDGNDWEFVQYFSQDRAKRNDYELPKS